MNSSSNNSLNSAVTTGSARRRPAAVIDKSSGAARLLVDGEPFYVRGVELHNSTPTSADAFAQALDTANSVHANVVLAGVTWEMIEPVEGQFDFSSVSRMIHQARVAGTRLVLLWFGAWKNGVSSYAPLWVKRDWQRFPLCVLENGSLTSTLTPFGSTDLDLDAFVALIRFVEEIDGEHRTVLMVQIENEIGLLGDSRDRSASANAAFTSTVPTELRAAMRDRAGFGADTATTLTWSDVTEDTMGRDEAFMAFGYATHVQKLAAAGRTISDIPFFVNAWLDSPMDLGDSAFSLAGGQEPGVYPSGGPLPRVQDVWKAVATDVALFAPDTYFGDPDTTFSAFSEMSGGLFVPEQRIAEDGVGTAFVAWGEYAALGVSPFGLDSRTHEELAPLADGYGILQGLTPLLTDADGHRRHTRGFHLTDNAPAVEMTFGDINVLVARSFMLGGDEPDTHEYGLVIDRGDDTFVFAGRGFFAQLSCADPEVQIGIGTVTELAQVTGEPGRVLNGDETGGGTMVIHPPRVRSVSSFPIPFGHAHTGLSTVSVYRVPRSAP